MKTITDGSLNIEERSRPLTVCLSLFTPFFKVYLCLSGLPDHSGRDRGWAEEEEKDAERETEEEDRRGGKEKGWRDGVEVMEEGVKAAAVSQSVNGLEKPTQKELMCVALFKAGVFVCV